MEVRLCPKPRHAVVVQLVMPAAVLRAAVTEGLGAPLLQAYLAVKQAEVEHYVRGAKERRDKPELLYDRW